MRPGNTSACNNFRVFLQDTLNKLEEKKVGLVRAIVASVTNRLSNPYKSKRSIISSLHA
ncbi:hypothetical protein PGTDC60_0037 [Porphyromonas gingivalis TDC60]|nr:hypothetical protein PGTDC60_0037 [Porphyromonas gingivalis TDC60]